MHRLRLPSAMLAIAAAALISLSPTTGHTAIAGGEETASPSSPRLEREALEQAVNRAADHYAAGEFSAAERLFATVVTSPRASDMLKALAAFNRGAALLQLDRFDEAVAAFDMAESENFPYMGQLHLARGMAWQQLGRTDLAASEFSSALLADPNDPAIQRQVSRFFYKK